MKLLLAEDEVDMSEALVDILTYHKYIVDAVYDGAEALEYAELGEYDGIILDIMMPKMSGLEVLKKLRERGDRTPVLLLTAKAEIEDRIAGLDMGADDYISKPFRPRELVSRIGVVLRRSGKASAVLESGGITIDTGKAVVKREGNEIFLSALEYRILLILFQNKGMVLSREKLLEAIWDVAGDFVNDNTLTVYIKRLREKIEKDPAKPEIIKTIRGMGYGVF